jgi:hypothetical protein
VYVLRSVVAIMIGDLASDPDTSQLLLLVGVYLLKLGICAYVVWRLRRVHKRRAQAKVHAEAKKSQGPATTS